MRLRTILGAAVVLSACGGEAANRPPAGRQAAPAAPARGAAAAQGDPLGPRPEPGAPAPFVPPVPAVYKHPRGMTVWLLERHSLPIVAMQTVVPAGAEADPKGKRGVAWMTANMLDEGAGTRGPLELGRDLDRLGATLQTGAYADYSFAHLTVLKKNLPAAAAIYGDVLARPTFAAAEWTRVHGLWTNELRQRQSDPSSVAGVVVQTLVFGPEHGYGPPTNGTTRTAARVSLADVKAFYEEHWHPELATVVVAGDITRADLDPILESAFAGWKPAKAGNQQVLATLSTSGPAPVTRRYVVVDRPDAPQSVIAVGRRGIAAHDLATAPLVRVNAALGGSFTSRLNQDLREEHGWSYGARSRFSANEQRGIFVAQAAVQTEHTGDALKAMLADIDALAGEGLTNEEVEKTRRLVRSEVVEAFEGVDSAAARLARSAGLGLPADHEAKASAAIDAASAEDLKKLARQHLDLGSSVVVIVGPRAKIIPQLTAAGIATDKLEQVGPEGQ